MSLEASRSYGDVTSDQVIAADVAIVGSGPGGSAAAARLAESGKRVVMLEAGGHYRPRDFSPKSAEP